MLTSRIAINVFIYVSVRKISKQKKTKNMTQGTLKKYSLLTKYVASLIWGHFVIKYITFNGDLNSLKTL